MTVQIAFVLAASLGAAFFDVRTRRIPNALVGALLVAGLCANAALGWRAAAADAAIVAVVLLAGTFAFSLRLIGGGDVKLLAAAAGTLGYPSCVAFVLFTLIAGGFVGVVYAASRGRLKATFANVHAMALPVFAGAAPARPDGTPMPYAVAIFCGALCSAVLTVYFPHLRFAL